MYHLFNLEGKRAVITGGTGDLGRAIGEGFLEAGAEVVLIGTTEKAKEIARDQNCKGYKAHGLIGRLDTAEEREQLFSDALAPLTALSASSVLVSTPAWWAIRSSRWTIRRSKTTCWHTLPIKTYDATG